MTNDAQQSATQAVADFDAFWSEVEQSTTPVRILGEVVQLPGPGTLPLDMLHRMENTDTEDEAAMTAILAEVFNDPGLLDRWSERGITQRQVQTILVWVLANGSGTPISFPQALAQVDRWLTGDAAGEAKTANRQARRAAAKKPAPASTGRSSKRTSHASTVTSRKTSRA